MSAIDQVGELQQRIKELEAEVDGFKQQVNSMYASHKDTQAENKRLREAQRWIPVSERLPEVVGRYLVYTAYSGTGFYGVSDFRVRKSGGCFTGLSVKATHWTTLPASPQEVDDE